MRSAQCHLHGWSLRAPATSGCLMPHSAYALTGRIPAHLRFFIGGAGVGGSQTRQWLGLPPRISPPAIAQQVVHLSARGSRAIQALGRPGLPYPPPSLTRMVRCCMYNAWPGHPVGVSS